MNSSSLPCLEEWKIDGIYCFHSEIADGMGFDNDDELLLMLLSIEQKSSRSDIDPIIGDNKDDIMPF